MIEIVLNSESSFSMSIHLKPSAYALVYISTLTASWMKQCKGMMN